MKDFIREKLHLMYESEIFIPKVELPHDNNLTDADKALLRNVDFDDIHYTAKLEGNLISLTFSLPKGYPDISGIKMYIKKIKDRLFSVHDVNLGDAKGLGLGFKIYKKIIMRDGNLHSGKRMRFNNVEIPKIWEKLSNDPEIECEEDENGILCIPRI